MVMSLLAKGALMGLIVAIPIGPIGILCINRSLRHGFSAGVVTGLGSAIADGIYCYFAIVGVSALTNFLWQEEKLFTLLGALLLAIIGLKLVLDHKLITENTNVVKASLFFAFVSAFVLTFIDPLTIVPFTGMIAGLGVEQIQQMNAAKEEIVIGVIIGALMWWVIVCATFASLHHRISSRLIRSVNVCSGVLLLAFSALAIHSVA